MRFIFIAVICLLSNACGTGDSMNRTYVISKSHQTAAEMETDMDLSDDIFDSDDLTESSLVD